MSAADFEVFAASRWRQLMRAAWLLTGDWAAAEDLVQGTLARVWDAWGLVAGADEPSAYVSRMLTNQFLDGRRRRASTEVPLPQLPERAGDDPAGRIDERLALLDALNSLPPVQRAVIVLRYFDDLSIEQTARALGCSVGNVKSQSTRGLRKLRNSEHLDQILRETT